MSFLPKFKNINPTTLLLLKSLTFILCIAVSGVSITAILMNTKSYLANEERIKQEKAEQIIEKQKEREALILIEKQRKERQRLQAEFAFDKQQIKSKAEDLAKSGKYLEAIKSLKQYAGKFSKETSRLRNNLINIYQRKHNIVTLAKRKKLLQDIVKLLLGKKYSEAKSKLKTYPPPVPRELSAPINEIADIDKQVASTYLKDIGGIIAVKLANGDIVTARLIKVSGANLVIKYSRKRQTISVSDLVAAEKMKRVKFLSKAGKALYLGTSAWSTGSKYEALRYFSKLGENSPLSKEIITQTDTYRGRKAEMDSRVAFFRILGSASLLEDDIDKDFIAEKLRIREANKAKDRHLKEQLDSYCDKFSNTEFKNNHDEIINMIYGYLDDKVDFLRYSTDRIGKRRVIQQRLRDQPPEAFWDVPPTKNQRYFVKIEVGKYNSINIVIDIRRGKPFGRFAIDDDLDFNDKPELSLNKWQRIPLLCKYDKLKSQKFAIEFKFDSKRKKILFRTGCIRTGLVKVGKNMLEVSITDRDAYGDYSRILKNNIEMRKSGKGQKTIKIQSNLRFEVDGKLYIIKSIEKNGSHIKIAECDK